MDLISNNLNQIVAVLGVVLILTLGRAKILPKARNNKFLLWVAFAVTIVCGLTLGYALAGVTGWLVSRTSIGGFSIVGLVAVWMGWHSVAMLVDLIRDVADGQPDEDARKAALWIPTLLPAGAAAVWEIAANPRGVGTGITAAIMAGITIGYVSVISNKAVKGKKGKTAWLWFAAAVCLLGGLAAIPLVLYVDGWVAGSFPAASTALRILAGFVGLALLIGALADIADKVPDSLVRLFLRFGLPLLAAFGAVAVSTLAGGASNGAELLTGVAA